MSSSSGIQWRRRHNWEKLDPQILLCYFAPTVETRRQMLERIQVRHHIPHTTLVNRARYIGARSITAMDGAAAVRHYGRAMQGLIRTYRMREVLAKALRGQMRSLRKQQRSMADQSIDFKYVARLLHIRVEVVRALVVDLQLLPQDEHGKIPVLVLRQFLADPANRILFAGWKLARMRQALGLDTPKTNSKPQIKIFS